MGQKGEIGLKKAVCMLLSVLLLGIAAMGTSAEEMPPTVNIVRSRVTIEGRAEAGKWLSLLVTDKEAGTAKTDIFMVMEAEANAQGIFAFAFDMPVSKRDGSDIEGDYYYRVGVMGGNILWNGQFHYELPLDLPTAIAAIGASASGAEAAALLNNKKYSDLFAASGTYMTEFPKLSDTAAASLGEWMRSADCKEETFTSAFIPAFNEKLLIMRLGEESTAGAKTLLDSYDYHIALTDGRVYSELPETERQAIAASLAGKPFVSYIDVSAAADTARGLYQVKNTAYQRLHPVVILYAARFSAAQEDITYLNGLDDTGRSAVYERFKTKLATAGDIRAEQIGALLAEAVDAHQAGGTGGGTGSSTGGRNPGGSTSGGGKKSSLPNISLPETSTAPSTEYQKDEQAGSFDDMDGAPWAADAVNALCDKGIIRGVAPRVFEPNRSVTRAEYLKMALTAFELATHERTQEELFEDVALGDWYYYYVASGVRQGVVSGTGNSLFEPNREITREEMAVMLYRASQKGYVSYEQADLEKECFSDQDGISEYALEAVLTLNQHGVLSGMGNGAFAPGETATRAQAAQAIYNLLRSLALI